MRVALHRADRLAIAVAERLAADDGVKAMYKGVDRVAVPPVKLTSRLPRLYVVAIHETEERKVSRVVEDAVRVAVIGVHEVGSVGELKGNDPGPLSLAAYLRGVIVGDTGLHLEHEGERLTFRPGTWGTAVDLVEEAKPPLWTLTCRAEFLLRRFE